MQSIILFMLPSFLPLQLTFDVWCRPDDINRVAAVPSLLKTGCRKLRTRHLSTPGPWFPPTPYYWNAALYCLLIYWLLWETLPRFYFWLALAEHTYKQGIAYTSIIEAIRPCVCHEFLWDRPKVLIKMHSLKPTSFHNRGPGILYLPHTPRTSAPRSKPPWLQ